MKTLDRYVVREMAGPFLVGVVGFILVLAVDLLFTMADLIINKGVPLTAVLQLMLYKLPSLLILTFPVSTLFGTAMALGRLSKDNELTALLTSGVSLLRIAVPILCVGLLVSLASLATNEKLVPYANQVSSNIIRQIIYKQPLPEVKENVFFKDARNRYYYAKRVDLKQRRMEGVMVYELTDEKFPQVILAQTALFTGRLWDLQQGVIHKYDAKGYLKYEADFASMRLNVHDDILDFADQKGITDMDRRELTQQIKVMEKGGQNAAALLTELYMRFSVPLTCFVFALVGIPFSLSSPRQGQTWGVIMTIVFMFTFYVFASIGRSLGRGGVVEPIVAAFGPPGTFMVIGFIMLGYLGRNK
ncbi:MAG: LptF/LptG family permease [Candidatus Margulisbacteria bacterium]|jgi:lipopolysaccharide export system permease protein|nr:LptF/LptG family permease [Candidatus Margulisiibacteriota bacterium]